MTTVLLAVGFRPVLAVAPSLSSQSVVVLPFGWTLNMVI